jgi:hypothetical protein
MIQHILSSVDLTVFINSHLSVEIHCLKVMLSTALLVNTPNVFSKSVGLGHSLQSQKKHLSEVDHKSQLRDSAGM